MTVNAWKLGFDAGWEARGTFDEVMAEQTEQQQANEAALREDHPSADCDDLGHSYYNGVCRRCNELEPLQKTDGTIGPDPDEEWMPTGPEPSDVAFAKARHGRGIPTGDLRRENARLDGVVIPPDGGMAR